MNIPLDEFICMPISNLIDLISIEQISRGVAEEVFDEIEEHYIPNWR